MHFFSNEVSEKSALAWAIAREKLIAGRVYFGAVAPPQALNTFLS